MVPKIEMVPKVAMLRNFAMVTNFSCPRGIEPEFEVSLFLKLNEISNAYKRSTTLMIVIIFS